MKFFKKHIYTLLFSSILLTANTYQLLKVFVLPEAMATVVTNTTTTSNTIVATASSDIGTVSQTDSSYTDDNISINISTGRTSDTTYYVADIRLADASYLKTALAQNTFGTNVTEKTSTQAANVGALFAINGDYYGANSTGYVIKNGVLYRDSARSSDYEDLVVYEDGSFGLINESDTTAQELIDSGVVQTFAFGPALIKDGQIAVSSSDEVGRAMSDNPRTAIGIIEESDGSLHYIVIVSDGRTDESSGLTLLEMAELMKSYGVTTAYNLDGGGSSTMYFNGQVVNNPTTSGRISERAVSDIVYIGY
ncbi:phosphodiester glycosidase family protein [Streptococcus plurextorum]|uniref:phosphodiester glycosidase family protein n=1 Tax=Streptococcus plurextorum TaxID=456876 RepID=UPI0004154791|nr:phosphodiester glycosidase family protein [Streptococcus plurextorum]